MDQVNLDTTPETPPQTVNTDTGGPMAIPVGPEAAADRALKAKTGIPSLPYSYGDLYNSILDGDEQKLRDVASKHVDAQKETFRNEALTNIAIQKGGALSEREKGFVNRLIEKKFRTDPQSVFEEYYPVEFLDNLKNVGYDVWDDSWWKDVRPEYQDAAISRGRDFMTKKEFLETDLDNLKSIYANQSYIGAGIDRLKEISVIYQNAKQRGAFGVPILQGALGGHLEEESLRLWRLPFEEFKPAYLALRNKIVQDNPGLAVSWAESMLDPVAEKASNDFFGSLIIPTATAGVAASVIKRMGARQMTEQAIKSAIDYKEKPVTEASMKEAAGDLKGATISQAKDEIASDLTGTRNSGADGMKAMLNMFSTVIDKIKANPTNQRQEWVNRVMDIYERTKDKFIQVVTNKQLVERIPGVMAMKQKIAEIAEDTIAQNPNANGRIMGWSLRRDSAIRGWWIDYYIGDEGPSMFANKGTAEYFAHTYLRGTYWEVGPETQKGMGHDIRVSVPFPETGHITRDALITTDAKTPQSTLNAFAGWLRTPEETLSVFQQQARKIATYGPSNFFNLVKDFQKKIPFFQQWKIPGTSARKKWEEWKDVVNAARSTPDPITGEKNEMRVLDMQEFNNLYMNKVKRLPDEAELESYYGYMGLELMRETWQKANKASALHRLGAMSHEVSAIDPALGPAKFGKPTTRSVRFLGTQEKEFPTGNDPVLVIGNKLGSEIVKTADKLKNSRPGKRLLEDIKQGKVSVFRVAEPTERLFFGFGKVDDSLITHVITSRVKTSPINWDDIKTGRSPDFNHDHYIVQPIIRKDPTSGKFTYEGDRVIAAFNIRAMGKDVLDKLNTARELVLNKDWEAARKFLRDNHLPFDNGVLNSWFRSRIVRGAMGRYKAEPAALRKDVPMYLVPHKNMSIEMPEFKAYQDTLTKFEDATKSGYGRFLDPDKRDFDNIFTLQNEGTRANPLYKMGDLQRIDPINSVNRALNRVINTSSMQDYKILSVEGWIGEVVKAKALKAKDTDVQANPFHHFYNPVWNEGIDPIIKANLETARQQIRQFLGFQNVTETFLHSMAQSLSDSLYSKGRAGVALTPAWLLPKLRDPAAVIRSLVFDWKLGLFNPAQLWVQANTFTTIWGIAGAKFAAPGTKAALLHLWSGSNATPEILRKYDKMMSTTMFGSDARYRPGHFLEARELLNSTGFANVGGEYVSLNKSHFNLTGGAWDSVLNIGRWPFQTGERAVRLGAWYTAYAEFRGKLPTAKITEAHTREIMNRADLLYANMSRASASTWQRGVFSIPTQFLAYSTRMAELALPFASKRLTPKEKARLFLTYGAVYGIPGTLGLTGFPLGDYMNKIATEQGYQVGNNYITSTLMQGIPALMIALTKGIAGGTDPLQRDNWYNFQERYGVQGFEPLREALRSDKKMIDIVLGAAGTTLWNTFSNADGLWHAMMSMVKGDGEFKLKIDDFIDPFMEISSASKAKQLIGALNTGKWRSRNDDYISDASMPNAIFMTLSGLSPQGTVDANTIHWSSTTEEELQKDMFKKALREMRRSTMSMEAKDPQQAIDYMKRAMSRLHVGGYPMNKMAGFFSTAAKDHETVLERMAKDYYFGRNVPEYRSEIGMKAYIDMLKNRGPK